MNNLPLTKALGYSVKIKRHSSGISQEELAEKAGLDRTYISDLERGARNPSLLTLFKLASALGISVTSLLYDAEAITEIDSDSPEFRSRVRKSRCGNEFNAISVIETPCFVAASMEES